jgi:transglutaminase-like putative cysteine protease
MHALRGRRSRAAPDEGWSSLVLVALVVLVMALAIDDSAWVLGESRLTDFLAIAALGGVMAGFVGSKVGWSRWVAHAIGAAFAALLVPLFVGQLLAPGTGLLAQYAATGDAAIRAWMDLVVLRLPATHVYGHHLLLFGLFCWGTAQFASTAVFRHHQPLGAVTVVGAVLIANMVPTQHNQLWFLVGFSVAALLLLARLHALDQQAIWTRRRIGDPTAIRAIYLRGGSVFVSVAVLGALTLTATARWSPLADAWDDLKPYLQDLGGAVERFLPTLEEARGIGGPRFGQEAIIRGAWTFSEGTALTVERPPGDDYPYYWRTVAFDEFIDVGWQWTGEDDVIRLPRGAGQEILEGSFDRVLAPGTKEVPFRITPEDLVSSWAVSPLTPWTVDRPSVLIGAGDEAFFQAIELPDRNPYTITARVPLRGAGDGGLTGNKLRAAGQNYPPELEARYTQLTFDAVGPNAERILEDALLRLKAAAREVNPYDLAIALRTELRSSRFEHNRAVTDIQAECGDVSIAECFATYRQGYCRHFATLMAVLLRHQDIPARVVEGFLPGDLNEATGFESIPNKAAHAWVEVYFPGYGWYPFDPTGGDVARTRDLPAGPRVDGASPSRFPSLPTDRGEDGPSRSPGAAVTQTPPDGNIGPGGFVVITLLLLATVAIIGFTAWRRDRRRTVTPEGAWAGIGKLAAWFGFGPRPTETAYEYASALGEVLPEMRRDLEAVATARVEVAYGGRILGDDRLRAIRGAYAKLRVGLLRLVIRRRGRRRR